MAYEVHSGKTICSSVQMWHGISWLCHGSGSSVIGRKGAQFLPLQLLKSSVLTQIS